MPGGRPKAELTLSDAERDELVALTLRRKTAQALALRARIVLGCADGLDNNTVATRQRVTPQTVSKWRGVTFNCGWKACWMHSAQVLHAR